MSMILGGMEMQNVSMCREWRLLYYSWLSVVIRREGYTVKPATVDTLK